MTREQYEAINGFSNSFFGWGGEDDDLYNRLELCVFCFIFRKWKQFENNLLLKNNYLLFLSDKNTLSNITNINVDFIVHHVFSWF